MKIVIALIPILFMAQFFDANKYMAPTAHAQETATADKKAQKKRRVTVSMTEQTYKKLTRIHGLIGEEKYDAALKLLKPLVRQLRNDYERAITFQTYGFIYASREQYPQATENLEKALSFASLPPAQEQDLTFTLAQLYIVQGQHKQGIETMERWFSTAEEPDGHAYAMLASAYSQDRQFDKAIPALEKAIRLTDDPEEAWYRLLTSMYYQVKQYTRAAETLEIMTARWPENMRYWKQLSSVYLILKNEARALAVLDIAYQRGYLSEQREILRLASLHAYRNDPYEAAQVLESGIEQGLVEANRKHLELLGNYYVSAQETPKALEALIMAAKLADNGKIDQRVAYLLIEQENWQLAEQALQWALEKGGLDKPGKAWLLRGMAAYELGDYASAREHFQAAGRFQHSRADAAQWVSHIDTEQAALSAE